MFNCVAIHAQGNPFVCKFVSLQQSFVFKENFFLRINSIDYFNFFFNNILLSPGHIHVLK